MLRGWKGTTLVIATIRPSKLWSRSVVEIPRRATRQLIKFRTSAIWINGSVISKCVSRNRRRIRDPFSKASKLTLTNCNRSVMSMAYLSSQSVISAVKQCQSLNKTTQLSLIVLKIRGFVWLIRKDREISNPTPLHNKWPNCWRLSSWSRRLHDTAYLPTCPI